MLGIHILKYWGIVQYEHEIYGQMSGYAMHLDPTYS